MSTLAKLEDDAEKQLGEEFEIEPAKGLDAEEVAYISVMDALPVVATARSCPVCGKTFDKAHPLLFFLDQTHHDNVVGVLKFHIGLANKVEALAARLANSGGENLFHEKDVVGLLRDMYEKGPAAVSFALGVVGYYATHVREYEGVKRDAKVYVSEVLGEFTTLADFYQAKRARFEELWGDGAGDKMTELWGREASADIRRLRSMILKVEVLMSGEMEKVRELVHEDPMQWMAALAKAGVSPVQPPPPALPPSPPRGVA